MRFSQVQTVGLLTHKHRTKTSHSTVCTVRHQYEVAKKTVICVGFRECSGGFRYCARLGCARFRFSNFKHVRSLGLGFTPLLDSQ
jgi:hypothetical protein